MARLVDLAVAWTVLMFFLPLIALCLAIIAITIQGNPIFIQTRVGINGRPFRMIKMRTMIIDDSRSLDSIIHLNMHDDPRFVKLRNDPRVIPICRFMRKYSIDELPQMLNVLNSEMALVGPRPLPPDEDALVGEDYQVRRTVKPGITGLWQISGRNALSFERMMQLDCHYARSRTLVGDLRIMALTLPAVFGGQESC